MKIGDKKNQKYTTYFLTEKLRLCNFVATWKLLSSVRPQVAQAQAVSDDHLALFIMALVSKASCMTNNKHGDWRVLVVSYTFMVVAIVISYLGGPAVSEHTVCI